MYINIYPTVIKGKEIWVAHKRFDNFTKVFYCKTKDEAIKKIYNFQ